MRRLRCVAVGNGYDHHAGSAGGAPAKDGESLRRARSKSPQSAPQSAAYRDRGPISKMRDPVRLQLIDVLRRHAGKVCVCELVALFDLSQPTVSHHLKVLRQAGLVGSERRGLWAYYYVIPDALVELSDWLT